MPRNRKQRGKALIRELKQDVEAFERMFSEAFSGYIETRVQLIGANEENKQLRQQLVELASEEPTESW